MERISVADEAQYTRIDEALKHWRQGDCVLGEHWFLLRLNPQLPLSEAAEIAAAQSLDTAEDKVRGLMVATQTCDLVRQCAHRPFVEVCPLVAVADSVLKEIEKARRPNYAFVPGIAKHNLVADLDRVMTVEKAVVAEWERMEGCSDDHEARRLALSLARKRERVAFPDDFVEFTATLQKRIRSKHGKGSDEGRALRAMREIRVRAAPSWDAESVELLFLFIRNEDAPDFENRTWPAHLEAWLKYIPESGRFTSVLGIILTLDDLTARDYIESDPFDLDYLSQSHH